MVGPPDTLWMEDGAICRPGAASRAYLDQDGRRWRVCERPSPNAPWVRGPSYLVFECASVVRRVWHVPDDWPLLSDADLERLSSER